jgi:hypothetical protein
MFVDLALADSIFHQSHRLRAEFRLLCRPRYSYYILYTALVIQRIVFLKITGLPTPLTVSPQSTSSYPPKDCHTLCGAHTTHDIDMNSLVY